MEQQALYERYDTTFSPTNEGGPIGQANVAVISTVLSTFICPSVPGGNQRTYNAFLPAGALPGLNAVTWSAAPSDYCVTAGVRGYFANIAYNGAAGGNRHGALRFVNPTTNPKNTISAVIDGTSHTFIFGERTGGSQIYADQRAIIVPPGLGETNGGGWGDPLNGEHWHEGAVRGAAMFPIPYGRCAVNCTNLRGQGFHSFHPGGAQFLMVDGSVKMVTENVDVFVFAAQITREKGEVL